MTEQATTTDELAFTRPYGEQEKQILTAEAVEFLTELVRILRHNAINFWQRAFSSSKILITERCLILFRKQLPFAIRTGKFVVFPRTYKIVESR